MQAFTAALMALLPLIGAAPTNNARDSGVLQFPGNPQVGCTHRDIIDHASYDWATKLLGGDLSDKFVVPGHKITYRQTGSGSDSDPGVKIGMCNYSGDPQGGSQGEVDSFNALLDSKCGSYKSGWVYIDDWKKTYLRTTNPGDDPCGNI